MMPAEYKVHRASRIDQRHVTGLHLELQSSLADVCFPVVLENQKIVVTRIVSDAIRVPGSALQILTHQNKLQPSHTTSNHPPPPRAPHPPPPWARPKSRRRTAVVAASSHPRASPHQSLDSTCGCASRPPAVFPEHSESTDSRRLDHPPCRQSQSSIQQNSWRPP